MLSLSLKKNTWIIVLLSAILGILFQNKATSLYSHLPYLFIALSTFGLLSANLHGSYMETRKDKGSILFIIFTNILNFLIILAFKNHFSEDIFKGLIMISVVSNSVISFFVSNLFSNSIYKTFVISVFSGLFLNLVYFNFLDHFILFLDLDLVKFVSFFLQFILLPFIFSYIISIFKFTEKLCDYGNNISILILALINFILIGNFWPIISENLGLIFLLILILLCLYLVNILTSFLIYRENKDRISYISVLGFRNAFLLLFLFDGVYVGDVLLPAIAAIVVNIIMLLPSRYLKNL